MNGQTPLSLDLGSFDETLILERLDLYNWGPFARSHTVEIDPQGTSIIGPTGSGKTTLVDALMTLIVANPRYNLASTGGHDSDRDLMSYVRGVVGHGNDSGDASHISRPGRTVTGLAARFARPGRSVTLAALLWTDGTSMSAADCKKRWLISESGDEGLEHWLGLHHDGGARALKAHCERQPRVSLFETKRTYLARVRRLFDITENAFDLLNRAAGLKQLDSVDQIFRDLVLDDHSGFKRAGEVAAEFDHLAGIRAELETARTQQRSLQPLVQLGEDHRRITATHEELVGAGRLVPRWFAHAGARLWRQRTADLGAELADLGQRRAAIDAEIDRLRAEAERRRNRYFEVGGADLEALDEQLDDRRRLLEVRRRDHDDYRQIVNRLRTAVQLPVDEPTGTTTAEQLSAVQAEARNVRSTLASTIEDASQRFESAAAGVGMARQQRSQAAEELDRIRARPGSNVPLTYQDFRAELAHHLGRSDAELPYVAELLSVRVEEREWRGAIERALGPHRLRILVPDELLDEALQFVNHRHNAVHVRLEAAGQDRSGDRRQPFADSFLHKLDLKDHPLRPALWRLLLSVDRHCVASADALRSVEHAMTAQGLLSGRSGRFDKRDDRRLGEGWLTGFDNSDQIAALSETVERAGRELEAAEAQFEVAERERDGFRQGASLLDSLAGLTFDRIDVASAERAVEELEHRQAALLDPGTDAGQAHEDWRRAEAELEDTRGVGSGLDKTIVAIEIDLDRAAKELGEAEERAGGELSPTDRDLAATHLPDLAETEPDQLTALERRAAAVITDRVDSLRGQLEDLGQRLVRQMEAAKKDDTGHLTDVDTELADLPSYLERLRVLTEEALPARQRRFLDYLNQSSDQGVSSLLATIEAEVDTIIGRIDDLNRTLQKVDYQPGRYLQLRPTRVVQQALQDLVRSQKALAAARLTDDQGETQYRALERVIDLLRTAAESRATLWARALLDPRHRLTFSVAVIDRMSGGTVELRTSSEGGSGGEKEIIASYILTASLSYALCPDGSAQPLFGTIVLDKAFSKSSQTVAGRIIEALEVFGLHPLFVTPNKELSLLRAHTRSAVLVNRKGHESRLVTISWEELDRRRPRSEAPVDLTMSRGDPADRAMIGRS